jgi:hypothetical protein
VLNRLAGERNLSFMAVYARTEEGQWAAYNDQSALPRKLKSLLRVIDGKTSTEVYVSSLVAYGDVMGLLQSLEMAGLVRLVDEGLGRIKVNTNMSPQEKERLKQGTASSASEWSETRMSSRSAPPSGTGAYNASAPAGNAAAWGFNASTQYSTQQAGQNPHARAALARAVDLMSTFVLTHLPGAAVSLLAELEALTSLEQLAVTLGGYEQLVSSAGPASVDHVREIKEILRNNI